MYDKPEQSKNKKGTKKEIEELRDRRVKLIQAMLDKSKGPKEISDTLNLGLSLVGHLISRYCQRPKSYVKRPNFSVTTLMDWQSECDPSVLTPEQVEHAKKVDIPLGRYAWLLSCPRGGNTTKR